jgi:hypothetical protein
VGKPVPGWSGIVECEVLAVEPPVMLQHTWQGDQQDPSLVTWRIEPLGPGAGPGAGPGWRLTYDHTGLRGVDGFIMATFVLGPIRRRMLTTGLPPVLDAIDGPIAGPIDGPIDGTVRPGSPRE